MKTTNRNRAAALGIAAAASLATVGVAGGPALAGPDAEAAPPAVQESQSQGNPTNSLEYADDLVSAYGVGSDTKVEELATQNVVDALSEHGDAHATRWHRITADGAAGTTYVTYTNLDTGETMTLGVGNESASNGDDHSVRQVSFEA